MITDIELIHAHFQSKKVIRLEPNGQDIKTGEYTTPGCYIKAETFSRALQILAGWEEYKVRTDIIFDHELEELRNGAWYKQ